MGPVGDQRFDDAQALARTQFESHVAGGVRLVGRSGGHTRLRAVEQQALRQGQIARRQLGVIDLGLRLAVEELPVEVEPRIRPGRCQHLAVDAVAADAVRLLQAVERQRLAKERSGPIAGILVPRNPWRRRS